MRKVVFVEEAPPGREKQVKALKKKYPDDQAFAIAWSSYNKSNGKKKTKKEDFSHKLDKALGLVNENYDPGSVEYTFDDIEIDGVLYSINTIAHNASIAPAERATYDYPGTPGGVEDFDWDIVSAYKWPDEYSEPVELFDEEIAALKKRIENDQELNADIFEVLADELWKDYENPHYEPA